MKDDRLYLFHILESAEKIVSYTHEGRDVFMVTPLIQDAVMRNFQIIGEAAKKVSPTLKSEYPDIRWRDIAGFRDILTHTYMAVDMEEIWIIIQNELPELLESVRIILERYPLGVK
jgi:uncharacterized protein with HEPN domain